jgi:integrase
VNKRRTALMHLYSVLDGKEERNPVRDVPKFREPAPEPKGIPYPIVRQLFQQMRDGKSKARLMVLAYTGIPHAQMQQIQASDFDPAAATVRVPGRKKGAGTNARIVPLTPDGVRAFKAMARNEAWGTFSRSSLHKAFRRACHKLPALKASADQLTPYDLRHSFGTEVYRSSGDIRATQILMDHSTPTLTHRYTLAAVDPRVAAAVKAFGKAAAKPASRPTATRSDSSHRSKRR